MRKINLLFLGLVLFFLVGCKSYTVQKNIKHISLSEDKNLSFIGFYSDISNEEDRLKSGLADVILQYQYWHGITVEYFRFQQSMTMHITGIEDIDIKPVSLDIAIEPSNIRVINKNNEYLEVSFPKMIQQGFIPNYNRTPNWIKTLPEHNDFIYGVGLVKQSSTLSKSFINSRELAFSEIAKKLIIKSESEAVIKEIPGFNIYHDRIKETTSVELRKIRIIDYYYDGLYVYALAEMYKH